MAVARVLLPVVLLVALVGAAGALAAWGAARDDGATGGFRVLVEGPDGLAVDQVVRVEDATALSVLEAAAAETGLALEIERYPGMGAYVRAIGPWRAEGAAGWIYEVGRDGAWTAGSQSAAYTALQAGDEVRWRWTDG